MTGHLTFIALAYGFTLLAVAVELAAIARRRRAAIERAAREADLDEELPG
ncbi:MAG TPA: heme exporter protein CcmD [Burkholderiaceae bacterium]|nr:heme exporter protein CcmD [Burkholderiaceae bacterium]